MDSKRTNDEINEFLVDKETDYQQAYGKISDRV